MDIAEVIFYICIGSFLSGWIIGVISVVRANMFYPKMMPKVIYELNKNLYCDVADKFQEAEEDIIRKGSFQLWTRRHSDAGELFLKLSISPEKTRLYYYQQFFKVTMSLRTLAMVFGLLIPCSLFFIAITCYSIFNQV